MRRGIDIVGDADVCGITVTITVIAESIVIAESKDREQIASVAMA